MRTKRQIHSDAVVDSHLVESVGYNISSGGFKNTPIGPKLKPLNSDGSTFTTNATVSVPLGIAGLNLAIYNNAGAVGSVTVSPLSVASLAPGATDAAGNVGVACPPNAWTYISMGDAKWVIASAATLLVYQIDDDSFLSQSTSG
jgi:hypothetical protein